MFTFFTNIKFIFAGDASKIRNDHETLLASHETLLASVAEINTFIGHLIMMLHRRKALTSKELGELIQHYTQLASPNLNMALLAARGKQNPLTPEEADRLEQYINMVNEGRPFSDTEINDYYELVEMVKKEQLNPWPLVALGAFLLGLYLGSQRKEEHP